jgi:hypothetical protein
MIEWLERVELVALGREAERAQVVDPHLVGLRGLGCHALDPGVIEGPVDQRAGGLAAVALAGELGQERAGDPDLSRMGGPTQAHAADEHRVALGAAAQHHVAQPPAERAGAVLLQPRHRLAQVRLLAGVAWPLPGHARAQERLELGRIAELDQEVLGGRGGDDQPFGHQASRAAHAGSIAPMAGRRQPGASLAIQTSPSLPVLRISPVTRMLASASVATAVAWSRSLDSPSTTCDQTTFPTAS